MFHYHFFVECLSYIQFHAGAATAAFSATWDWQNSTTAVSCLDYILRQDATRMQKELVNVYVSMRAQAS